MSDLGKILGEALSLRNNETTPQAASDALEDRELWIKRLRRNDMVLIRNKYHQEHGFVIGVGLKTITVRGHTGWGEFKIQKSKKPTAQYGITIHPLED